MKIDAEGVYYKELNKIMREALLKGTKKFTLYNVSGQRYIGSDLDGKVRIDIYGTPGNDLAAFMDGPRIVVHGNGQDGIGNTMNEGEVIIYGHSGDITGLSMRGGKIFIKENVGYRVGIHMKSYQSRSPLLIIGGTAYDFLGEYMAGGTLIVLGLNLKEGEYHQANFIGTGMHGGVIYLRGKVHNYQLGKEVSVVEIQDSDYKLLKKYIYEFAKWFELDPEEILKGKFIKLLPLALRPYGKIYCY